MGDYDIIDINIIINYNIELKKEIERLKKCGIKDYFNEIAEVYIGMDGVAPETSKEKYLMYLLKKTYELAIDGIEKIETK